MERKFVWLGLFVGSTVGSFLPELWGGGLLSFSSIFWSFVGGIVGIWAGYKIGQSL